MQYDPSALPSKPIQTHPNLAAKLLEGVELLVDHFESGLPPRLSSHNYKPSSKSDPLWLELGSRTSSNWDPNLFQVLGPKIRIEVLHFASKGLHSGKSHIQDHPGSSRDSSGYQPRIHPIPKRPIDPRPAPWCHPEKYTCRWAEKSLVTNKPRFAMCELVIRCYRILVGLPNTRRELCTSWFQSL